MDSLSGYGINTINVRHSYLLALAPEGNVTRDQRRDLIEAVGLVTIVASLVFLALEVRQNTVAARAAAYQAIGIATASAFDTRAHDREFFRIDQKSADEMDEVDWSQYATKMTVFARLGETVLLQIEQGVLPADAMERLGFRGWAHTFDDPKLACVWPLIRSGVSDSFREYVEGFKTQSQFDCAKFNMPSTY